VANVLKLHRVGDIGFIEWLGLLDVKITPRRTFKECQVFLFTIKS